MQGVKKEGKNNRSFASSTAEIPFFVNRRLSDFIDFIDLFIDFIDLF